MGPSTAWSIGVGSGVGTLEEPQRPKRLDTGLVLRVGRGAVRVLTERIEEAEEDVAERSEG